MREALIIGEWGYGCPRKVAKRLVGSAEVSALDDPYIGAVATSISSLGNTGSSN